MHDQNPSVRELQQVHEVPSMALIPEFLGAITDSHNANSARHPEEKPFGSSTSEKGCAR